MRRYRRKEKGRGVIAGTGRVGYNEGKNQKRRRSKQMHIIWLGHSCFKIESREAVIIVDPYKDGSVPGLGNVRENADIVLCSHGHDDH